MDLLDYEVKERHLLVLTVRLSQLCVCVCVCVCVCGWVGGGVGGEGVRVCTVCERVSLYMFRE